jgi:thiol:disulfide interchange protein
MCFGSSKSWILWGGLILLAGLYIYANRATPASFQWVTDHEAAFAQAQQTGRPVFMDFYASWCPPCKSMDREVFSRDDVARAMDDWVPLKIDVDQQDDLANQHDIQVLPTLLAATPEGEIVARYEGYMSPEQLIDFLRRHAKSTAATQTAPDP